MYSVLKISNEMLKVEDVISSAFFIRKKGGQELKSSFLLNIIIN